MDAATVDEGTRSVRIRCRVAVHDVFGSIRSIANIVEVRVIGRGDAAVDGTDCIRAAPPLRIAALGHERREGDALAKEDGGESSSSTSSHADVAIGHSSCSKGIVAVNAISDKRLSLDTVLQNSIEYEYEHEYCALASG